jgi:hypothetical protein
MREAIQSEVYAEILKKNNPSDVAYESAIMLEEALYWKNKYLEQDGMLNKLIMALDVMGVEVWQQICLDPEFLLWIKKCPDGKDLSPKDLLETQKEWFMVDTLLGDLNTKIGEHNKLTSISELKTYLERLK